MHTRLSLFPDEITVNFQDPRITEVLTLLHAIKAQGEKLMTDSVETLAVLKRIDDATTIIGDAQTELAADIQEILNKPNATAQEFRDLLEPRVQSMEAQAAFLRELAHNTNAPVPELPPIE